MSFDAAQRPDKPGGGEKSGQVSEVLDRNISALLKRRTDEELRLTFQDRTAGRISRFAGSMPFVYLHMVIFGAWILINVGVLPLMPAFDPSLVILAMVASVEAIFISTFVMINQNRMAKLEEKRSELSLQVSLLSEHETTKLITMVSAIVRHLQVPVDIDGAEIEELTRNIPPEVVLEKIEREQENAG